MKTLFLLRHAKSSWDNPALHDFDRPLAPRGERDAPAMGQALARLVPAPNLVYSSPAARTRATLEIIAREAGWDVVPRFLEQLYGASCAELMRLVRKFPDTADCALIVGHNPGLEDLVGRLSGAPQRMPTTAFAWVEIPCDSWAAVEDWSGKLVRLLTPKTL